MKKILALILLVTILHSCIPTKELIYFQGEPMQNEELKKLQNEPYKLQVNDMLDIQIKSSEEKLDDLFQRSPTGNTTIRFSEEALYFSSYTVSRQGTIRLPFMGEINVLGYTTSEVREKIDKEFETYFKNPDDVFVTVKLTGIRFTVLGEVGKTGTLVLYQNQVNLIEAIANAGDIKMTGNRKKVSVFRKNIDGTKRYEIDMLDVSTFDSENFYIESNDIIYVEPLKQKSWGTGTTGMQTITTLLAVLSLITTTILLVNAYK